MIQICPKQMLNNLLTGDGHMTAGVILPSIILAAVGWVISGPVGGVYGLAAGYLLGAVHDMKRRIDQLEKQVNQQASYRQPDEMQQAHSPKPAADAHMAQKVVPTPQAPSADDKQGEQSISQQRPENAADFGPASAYPSRHSTSPKPPAAAAMKPADAGTDMAQKISGIITEFFTKGNVVVKIGLIILFFGVGFLIKYTAQRNMLPIELRLCLMAAGGMLMLGLGWRLRHNRHTYAMLIQGGGVGILYLNVFAAAKLYGLVPPALGFFLQVGLVFLSVVLSLLQDTRAMALFAAIGGFLAPVLMATGSGDHVFLFSFYALLNAGILGISWFKAWRELNLAGFVFTFIISTAWGVTRYQPEYFASTEPFLILFFLMYAAISVLYAIRQPIDLKGYIDGPLVFGLPLIIFGLQAALVRPYEYGMAWSAVALSTFYLLLVRALWKRKIEGMRILSEVFLSLGVIFASIAIPLALDSSWTSGLWGLEGAGLVWVGLRQKRFQARSFGLLLQLGAGVSFLYTVNYSAINTLPVLNGIYMSCLVISLAGLISNYCYDYFGDRLRAWESRMHLLLLIWSLAWWFGGSLNEIAIHVPADHKLHAAVGFIAASLWFMGFLHRRLNWTDLGRPPLGLIPILVCMVAGAFADSVWSHPFAGWGGPAWAAALACQYHLLRKFENRWPDSAIKLLHSLSLYLALFLITWEVAWHLDKPTLGPAWQAAAWGAFPALAALLLVNYGRRISWPVRNFAPQYLSMGQLPVMGMLWLWALSACFMAANPAPLSYIPVFNPLEIAQVFALLVIARWWKDSADELAPVLSQLPRHSVVYAIGAASFLWLNGVTARTVHYWGGVSWQQAALFDSVTFQTAISIIWTITALGIMITATRKYSRTVWFIGSVILGLVVAKLFLVDLSGIGTVARIISFLAVGLLMLVIGYFSPLPPKPIKEAAA